MADKQFRNDEDKAKASPDPEPLHDASIAEDEDTGRLSATQLATYGGSALPGALAAQLSSHLDADVSSIRVHTDPAAAAIARAAGARPRPGARSRRSTPR